ncbi:hypothetical protein BJ912DRAFT_808305, partial [Pholiota molesta]
MLEPRLQNWYVTQMDRIDKLSLDEYIAELSAFALDKNWAHHTKQQIHSAKQPENSRFVDWRIEIENLNAILNTSAKKFALSEGALRNVLEANTRASLAVSLANKPIDASLSYQEWSDEVHSRDQELRDEEKRVVAKLIDHRKEHRERKTLLQRMDTRQAPYNGAAASSGSRTDQSTAQRTQSLPKLTDEEKRLLDEHEGCRRCRTFYAGHRGDNCPLKETNSWPDASKYKPLTSAMALAAKPGAKRLPVGYVPLPDLVDDEADNEFDEEDGFYDDDTYAPPLDDPPPFTMPHFWATFVAICPSDPNSHVSQKSLLDIGCPSTVISGRLVDKLGLHRLPLPKKEDNLSSLSGKPLSSTEYVELVLTQSGGAWRSKVFRAKVNEDLPIPLLLGIPFLHHHRIVIDIEARTALQKDTGHDILNPLVPRVVYDNEPEEEPGPPDPTPPAPKPTAKPKPRRKAKETPQAKENREILAAIRTRIEAIAFQEELQNRDAAMKLKYADCFPTRLPDVGDMPDHLF